MFGSRLRLSGEEVLLLLLEQSEMGIADGNHLEGNRESVNTSGKST